MRVVCMASICLALAALPAGAAPLDFSASACPAPEARQFDFWIGEWDVLNHHLMPDGVWRVSGRATNKVYPVLDGCAIIEHWEGALGGRPLYGFSIRAWDPGAGKWKLVLNWPSPERPNFGMLEGVFTHGRGEFFFERVDENGNKALERYSFSDATDRSLRWDAARSTDDGVTWNTHWIMEFTRRDPAMDLPLFNGPERSRSRCRGGEFRDFDFTLGTWMSRPVESGAAAAEEEAPRNQVRAIPILEGCAIMEFGERLGEEPPFESFSIRSFLPALDKWVQYSIDTDRRVFERWKGTAEEGRIVLQRKEDEDETESGDRRRQVWSRLEDDSYEVKTEVTRDGGRTWSTDSTSRATREGI